MIVAALTKGVPHPSGYPLFTMLGIIFSYIPITATPAWKIGLISSLFSSLSVVLTYLIVESVTKNRYLSFLSSTSLAFSYTFWLYAEVAEVIALNNFFILLLTYLVIKYLHSKKNKYIFLLSFISGLSLTNNLSVALIFPAIVIAIFYNNPKILKDYKLILKSILIFILGLTPYIYIPIAASLDPLANWGQATSFDNFIRLIFRGDYGWGKAKYSYEVASYRVENYLKYWKIYINPLIPILAFLGIIYAFIKKEIKVLIAFFIPLLLFVPFLVTYPKNYFANFLEISSIEKFYGPGLIFAILFLPLGILAVQNILNKIIQRKKLNLTIYRLFLAAFFLIPLASFLANFERTNFKDTYTGDDFAWDIISKLPKKSVVFLVGDNEIFNTLYLQVANNIREDIYLPGRYEGFSGFHEARGLSDEEIKKYQKSYASGLLPPDLYLSLPNLVKNYPIYSDVKLVDFPVEDDDLGKLMFIPYGLVYKLDFEKNFNLTKEEYLESVNKFTKNYHLDNFHSTNPLVLSNFVVADIQLRYSSGYYEIAKFVATHYEDEEESLPYMLKAIKLEPILSKEIQ
ncbi:MAG: DUF2723 domain-containing protein [Candidatus Woesebacteria bacterium]